MEYRVGMTLKWIPARDWEPTRYVEVTAVLSRGYARLSNGWTVDEDGIAEGTNRQPGGCVQPLNLAFSQNTPDDVAEMIRRDLNGGSHLNS